MKNLYSVFDKNGRLAPAIIRNKYLTYSNLNNKT